MEKKILLKGAVVILILAVSVTGYLILSDKTAEPTDRVTAPVQRQEDGMFFKKAVDRIPARATVVAPEIENDTIKVGVSADRTELNFGVVVQNMSVTKFLNINNKDTQVKVCVVAYGDIAPLISPHERGFIVNAGESKEVALAFSGSELGNYTGEVDVITKKPKYGFMEFLLPYVAC